MQKRRCWRSWRLQPWQVGQEQQRRQHQLTRPSLLLVLAPLVQRDLWSSATRRCSVTWQQLRPRSCLGLHTAMRSQTPTRRSIRSSCIHLLQEESRGP